MPGSRLWAVGTTTSFEAALMAAVNRGEDADTVGAVTGQLVGALYGASAILERWIAPLPAQASRRPPGQDPELIASA